jgi:hypothetical protein
MEGRRMKILTPQQIDEIEIRKKRLFVGSDGNLLNWEKTGWFELIASHRELQADKERLEAVLYHLQKTFMGQNLAENPLSSSGFSVK